MSSVTLDRDNFFRRMKRLYSAWKDGHTESGESFPKIDAICTVVGSDEYVLYCKSLSLQIWLFGYDINDVIMIFTENSIHFLASKKKINFLRQIEQHKDKNSIPPVKLHIRNKEGNEKENFDKLIAALKNSSKGKTLGVFAKDDFPSTFIESWKKAIKEQSFDIVDISNALASLLSIKEETELSLMKKASQVSVDVFHKYLRDQIMDIIDSDKKVTHSKLADGVENAMTDKKYVGANVDTSQLYTCYPPIIESGGNYSLKFSATSDKNNLHFGVIVCSLGARYKMYCSNIIRTLLVNPNDSVQENYNFLIDLQEHLISVLKAGTRLCDVYNSGIDFAKEKKPTLVDNLTKNFGFVTGIEFRENSLSISSKTTASVKKSQVFNLCVGLSNLLNEEAESKECKNYSLWIGDTVVVNEEGAATVWTNSKKRIKNVGIFLKDGSDEEEESEKENEPQKQQILGGRGKRTAVLDSNLRQDTSIEENRKQHQEVLAIRLNEKARKRLSEQSSEIRWEKVKKPNVSYKNRDQMPVEQDVKQLKIFVDEKYETVIVPIYGLPVPFHVSTIKNVSQSVEGDYAYLRINFFYPGATMAKGEIQFPNPHATFTKELTYRSTNLRGPGETSAPSMNLDSSFRHIQKLQKKMKTRLAEKSAKKDLVKQDTLVISSNKAIPKLKNLFLRPTIGYKRTTGTLEAHVNGFRYKDEVVILYNNIKHAFFQPGDGEMMILLHFHLKNGIVIGKKTTLDVQFYMEVGESTTDLAKHQHMHDRDYLAAEQTERNLRAKLKTAFNSFCEKVTATTPEIEFDTPFSGMGFHGAPSRSTVLLQPTSDCLVNLTEWPPFVITLEDVELVHFERVQFQLKNFDMVFVFKDYHRKVLAINAIPMNMLDHVKNWLNENDIHYSQGILSLDWSKIMKTISNDLEGFFEKGGWAFLDPGAQSETDSSDCEDELYEPTDLESVEEDSEEDSEHSEASEDSDSESDS